MKLLKILIYLFPLGSDDVPPPMHAWRPLQLQPPTGNAHAESLNHVRVLPTSLLHVVLH